MDRFYITLLYNIIILLSFSYLDFSILQDEDEKDYSPNSFIQIVGHSIHARIKPTRRMLAIDCDGGMYLGRKMFLEITTTGRFISHQYNEITSQWNEIDLLASFC